MESSQSKRSWLRAFLIVAGLCVLAVGGVAVLVFFAFPSLGGCDNDNLVETVSFNGQLKAVTFRRNCGATTSYSTHVSILPVSRKLRNEPGNVFTANHEPSITLHWSDDHHLSVTGETETQFLHLTEFRGVSIIYQ